MNHWLFVCTTQGKGNSRITGRTIWQNRLASHYWGLGSRTANWRDIAKDDRVVFYIGGKGEHVFVGEGTVSTPAYDSSMLIESERRKRSINSQPVSPLFVDFKAIHEFDFDIPVVTLLENLAMFSGKTPETWGSVLQGGVRKLEKSDYDRIVRAGTGRDIANVSSTDEELARAYHEGNKKLAKHLKRERNPKLRRMKLELIPKAEDITCEACGFNFQEVYGKKYRECCEVHHRTPLSYSDKRIKVTVKDLAILCANCHRAIHRSGKPIMSVEDFREKVLGR